MPHRNRPSRAFTIFAFAMIAFLIIGTLVVFGGTVIGGDDSSPEPTVDEGEAETQALETRVAENPDDAEAAGVLANIYANEGTVAEAIPLYERAVEARPDDGGLRLAFGIALLRGGNTFDAEIQLNRALELDPDRATAAYYLGQLEESRQEPDLDAARAWYERTIEIDSESLIADQARQRLDELNGSDGTPTAES